MKATPRPSVGMEAVERHLNASTTPTNEELAEWDRQVHSESAAYVTVHLAPKLIAALRASREEVERLRKETPRGNGAPVA